MCKHCTAGIIIDVYKRQLVKIQNIVWTFVCAKNGQISTERNSVMPNNVDLQKLTEDLLMKLGNLNLEKKILNKKVIGLNK